MEDGMTGAYHALKYSLCRVALVTRAAVDCSGTPTVAVGRDCSDDDDPHRLSTWDNRLLEAVVHASV